MTRTKHSGPSYIKPYWKKESSRNRQLTNRRARKQANQLVRTGNWGDIINPKNTQGQLTW